MNAKDTNVLGTDLELCCSDPMTGWYRDGFCKTDPRDYGVHTVCAIMTDEFLNYTSTCGNDLKTPAPQYGFPGLKPGDKWCLCASRWLEAAKAGSAPPVYLHATHITTLDIVPLELLQKHAAEDAVQINKG